MRDAVCLPSFNLEDAFLIHYVLGTCEEQINRHDPSSEYYWKKTDERKTVERKAAAKMKEVAAGKEAAAEKQTDKGDSGQYHEDPIAKE